MTFRLDQLCFIDTETRNLSKTARKNNAELKEEGTYRYFQNAKAVIVTYAIGDGPVECIAMDEGFDRPVFDWYRELPLDLRTFWQRAEAGEAWFAAWNAGFDKTAMNQFSNAPVVAADMVLDVMTQATASNMPPSLEGASKFIGRTGKQQNGKELIKLFSPADGGTPQTHPVQWAQYKDYARQDIDELREVFLSTRQLPYSEWEEYWAAERVNERGMRVDLDFCQRAAAVAEFNADVVNRELTALSEGAITKVTQHQKIANFLWDHMAHHTEARDLMVKTVTEEDAPEEDENTFVEVHKKPTENERDLIVHLTVNRDVVTKMITYFKAQPSLDNLSKSVLLPILELREFGASAAPQKFQKMLDQHVDGKLYGQYVFNGAGQTGRFSAKGVQVHNMTRDVLGKKGVDEAAAIEMINDLEDF